MIEKRYKKEERGITLIALIITIIVMLILVAVTIQVTISGGIFSKAGEAVGKTKTAEKNELDMIDDVVNKIDNINSKPNAPEVMEGMIAVTWDASQKSWVKTDETKDDWYEYGTTQSTKRWANAVTVKKDGTKEAEGETLIAGSKTREQYQEAETGTPILQEDILGMFVWIPRYAYKIPQENYHTSNAGIIDIKFLSGTSGTKDMIDGVEYNATTTSNFTKFPDGYVVHPAFSVENGEDEKIELTGIWVAKFEASSNTTEGNNPENEKSNMKDKYGSSKGAEYASADANTEAIATPSNDSDQVTIRPNVTSWRNINVKNCYIACTNMVKEDNIHGLTSSTDSHLMKDTEWGAVAYLTQSRYGNPQIAGDDTSGVWINSYSAGDGNEGTTYGTTRTGMVGIGEGAVNGRDTFTDYYSYQTKTTLHENGSITIAYQSFNTNGGTRTDTRTNTYYTYETNEGVHGSTTGTIYGIYDMSGGAWDTIASYLDLTDNTKNTNLTYFQNSVPQKHKSMYKASSTQNSNANYNEEENIARYGIGVWETCKASDGETSWGSVYSRFVHNTAPFQVRGLSFSYDICPGVFSLGRNRRGWMV